MVVVAGLTYRTDAVVGFVTVSIVDVVAVKGSRGSAAFDLRLSGADVDKPTAAIARSQHSVVSIIWR